MYPQVTTGDEDSMTVCSATDAIRLRNSPRPLGVTPGTSFATEPRRRVMDTGAGSARSGSTVPSIIRKLRIEVCSVGREIASPQLEHREAPSRWSS